MNRKKLQALIGLALVFIGTVGFILLRPKPSDQDQIQTALANAVKASKEGRAGGVVEYLASNVQVNGEKYDINNQFASFIRKYHPDIKLGAINPKIDGDDATVTTDLDISLLNNSIKMPNVTFKLHKEHDKTLLFFPSEHWKVTGASAPEEAYQQIMGEISSSGGMGGGLW
ncbi:MAG TPA: hypothetical protein VGL56_05125 [Fimbriimonadaceae bacterium]